MKKKILLSLIAILMLSGCDAITNLSEHISDSSVFSTSELTTSELTTSEVPTSQVDKENLLMELYNLTKTPHHTKRVYNDSWRWYTLIDRDYELSPLGENEVINGNDVNSWAKTGIWMRPLYVDRPLFIDTSTGTINGSSSKATFKYYDDNNNLVTKKFRDNGSQFDREHVFPKSFGFDGSGEHGYTYIDYYAGTDLHNLRSSDSRNNQNGHNNYYYGNVDKSLPFNTFVNNFTLTVTGYNQEQSGRGRVYEPLDQQKGDIARSIFYMSVRYAFYDETTVPNEPAITISDTNNQINSGIKTIETKTKPASYGYAATLLEWHLLDPVDDFERNRNNNVEILQGNRNPFIDNPEYATILFS